MTVEEDDGIDRVGHPSVFRGATQQSIPTPRTKLVRQASLVAPVHVTQVPTPRRQPQNIQLPPPAYATGLLSAKDRQHYLKAFKALQSRHWSSAFKHAGKANYTLPEKFVRWQWLRTYKSGASFDEITSFIIDNSNWPYRETMLRRAEQALDTPVSMERTLAWFADRTPVTGIGMLRYGEALVESGDIIRGHKWIRAAWVEGNFSERQEKKILRRHKSLLLQQDHEARLDRLLWNRKAVDAIRLLDRVGKIKKKLAVARIRLMRRSKNVDAALKQIPAEFQKDPGLQYERARWRRRKGKHEGAREILLSHDETVPYPEKWWTERQIQSRKLLKLGYISEAYQLVSKHGLTSGGDFASAEWLSGWISLRFLHDYDVALTHFKRMYNNVGYPISRARGAYWIGRAYDSQKDKKSARYWYDEASKYPSTFYGQIAINELGHSHMPRIAATPTLNSQTKAMLEKNELVRIVKHLAELGQAKRTRPFLLALTEQFNNPEEYAYLSNLAHTIERPDYAIAVAKRASQLGTELPHISWPTTVYASDNPAVELPLIMAITRQESAFAKDAISPVGARGLMQLMPATARAVSRKLKVSYSKNKLVENPDYNTLLGSTYLRQLTDRFDGSYILAIASYNAGPSRAKQWIREWGDPRTGEIDVIDWIELIPFNETRNYVQRVMENLQVYRQLLGNTEYQMVQIDSDLARGRSTF